MYELVQHHEPHLVGEVLVPVKLQTMNPWMFEEIMYGIPTVCVSKSKRVPKCQRVRFDAPGELVSTKLRRLSTCAPIGSNQEMACLLFIYSGSS